MDREKKKRLKREDIIRLQVIERDGATCFYCGKTCDRFELQVDHIIPKSQGGIDDLSNMVVCCKSCNSTKHFWPIDMFYIRTLKKIIIAKKQLARLQRIRIRLRLFIENGEKIY